MNVPSHEKWRREVQKNVRGERKRRGGTSGGLGSSYKGRVPVPFFNLFQAHKCGPKGPKKPKVYAYVLSTYDDDDS